MQRYKQYIIMVLGFVIWGKPSFALQTYPLVDHQSTSITISQTEQNRIAVAGDRIQQVFGAEGTFDIQSDEEGGQIFLKISPELQQGTHPSKPTTITIITESGLTQDLRLISKSVEFQSILFKPHYLSQKEKEDQRRTDPTEAPSRLQPIIKLLRAMARNESVADYTKSSLQQPDSCPVEALVEGTPQESAPAGNVNAKCFFAKSDPHEPSLLRGIKSDPLFIYKGEQFEGKVYTLTNQGKKALHLKEQDFALREDVAIHIPKNTLHPNEVTTLYIVSRRVP